MQIIEDVAQKKKKHELKHKYFDVVGIQYLRLPLPCGDYIAVNDAVAEMLARKAKRGLTPKKMDFLGTYDVCVDSKKDIQEIIGNVCGKQHERFKDECMIAKNNGIKLYVLVENDDGVKNADDLFKWRNPRSYIKKWVTTPSGAHRRVLKYPHATKGATLAKTLCTMEQRYDVKFMFCSPEDAGKTIVKILSEGNEKDGNITYI